MNLQSLHTHSHFCDGHGAMEDYLQAALRHGLTAYGPSSHSPVPWSNNYSMALADVPRYVAEARRLREAYHGLIEVYLGLELDFRPDLYPFYRQHIFPHGFDYFIGSVHLVGELDGRPWSFEDRLSTFIQVVAERYGGDARGLLTDYYALVRQVVEWPEVTILGHLDRIRVHNAGDAFFSEEAAWYVDLVEDVLDAVQRSGKMVELNTAGWRKTNAGPNPSPWIVRRCAERGIPMCLTPDAHRVEQIAFQYAAGIDLLQASGHRYVNVLKDGQWTPTPLGR